MEKQPFWIKRGIGIFVLLFVIVALGDKDLLDYTGLELISNYRRNPMQDLDNYIVTVLLLAVGSLAVSWLIDNIKRK